MARTLVAYYGPKPAALTDAIRPIQDILINRLGHHFIARPLDQIHATIVGLDKIENRLSNHPGAAPWPPAGVFSTVMEALSGKGLLVQLGGFENRDYAIASRGERLYARTFSIAGDSATAIAWPISAGSDDRSGDPSCALGYLRKSFETFGVRHKYHTNQSQLDCDLYFALGDINGGVATDDATALENEIRQIARANPATMRLTVDSLSIVDYVDRRLPLNTSRRWSLEDFWMLLQRHDAQQAQARATDIAPLPADPRSPDDAYTTGE